MHHLIERLTSSVDVPNKWGDKILLSSVRDEATLGKITSSFVSYFHRKKSVMMILRCSLTRRILLEGVDGSWRPVKENEEKLFIDKVNLILEAEEKSATERRNPSQSVFLFVVHSVRKAKRAVNDLRVQRFDRLQRGRRRSAFLNGLN